MNYWYLFMNQRKYFSYLGSIFLPTANKMIIKKYQIYCNLMQESGCLWMDSLRRKLQKEKCIRVEVVYCPIFFIIFLSLEKIVIYHYLLISNLTISCQ